jgi:hypothetical protein
MVRFNASNYIKITFFLNSFLFYHFIKNKILSFFSGLDDQFCTITDHDDDDDDDDNDDIHKIIPPI